MTLRWCHIILKNLSRGASRLTGRTAICIQGPRTRKHRPRFKDIRRFEEVAKNKVQEVKSGNMKCGAAGQEGAGFFEATLVPHIGKGRYKGPANASKSSN